MSCSSSDIELGVFSMTQDENLGFNELFPMPRPPMSYLKYFNARYYCSFQKKCNENKFQLFKLLSRQFKCTTTDYSLIFGLKIMIFWVKTYLPASSIALRKILIFNPPQNHSPRPSYNSLDSKEKIPPSTTFFMNPIKMMFTRKGVTTYKRLFFLFCLFLMILRISIPKQVSHQNRRQQFYCLNEKKGLTYFLT